VGISAKTRGQKRKIPRENAKYLIYGKMSTGNCIKKAMQYFYNHHPEGLLRKIFTISRKQKYMEAEKNELQEITRKFPSQAQRVAELYHANEDFRILCHDYLVCLKNLKKYKKKSGETQLTLNEYTNISNELENELSHFIFRL
jgi:DNA repair ATPase RecN